jgi:hypothetical protein
MATDHPSLILIVEPGYPQMSLPFILMPEVVGASKMSHEHQNNHEQRHEKKVLSDHDALLLSFPFAKISIALCTAQRCDAGNASM